MLATRKQSIRGLRNLGRAAGGQSIVELALALPFMVAIVVGSFAVGLLMERQLSSTQLVRHAGKMYARAVDFDDVNGPARRLMVDAAGAMQLSTAKGTCDADVKTVIYLTQVQITPDTPPGTFANEGQPVMTHRTLLGNSCVDESALGTLPNTIWDPDDPDNPGAVTDPFNESAAVATVPAALATGLIPGETVFVVEVIHQPTDLLFPGIVAPERMYNQGFF